MKKLIICTSIVAAVGVTIGVLSSCGGLLKAPEVQVDPISGEVTTEALGAFEKARDLLVNEKEYFVKGVGAVDAKKAGMNLTTQTIYAVSARNNDDYLIESNSYSGIVKCATRAYSTKDGVRVYKGNNVSKDGSTATWNDSTYTDYSNEKYEEDWGRQVSNPFNYDVTEDTLLSQELISSKDGVCEYLLRLDTEKSVEGYRRQMKTISSLPEKPVFSTVEFRFTVNENGYILSSTTYEKYKTKFGGFSADCVGSITSTYYYGDVKIPSLTENTAYTGTSKIDTVIEAPNNPVVSEKVYTPAEKIVVGFTSNSFSAFDADLIIKNPSLKEIAKLNLRLYLDLDDLENVKIQGNINSNTHGYYLDANFSIALGEKVLYLNSSRVNAKFDIENAQDASNKIVGFINQFLDNKINLELPEIDLDELLGTINDSVKEEITNDGNYKWTLTLAGIKIEVSGLKEDFTITKIVLPDFALNGYHVGLDVDVQSLEASPIIDLNIDESKTLDLYKTTNFLDFIQGFIDEKKFGLNAVASKIDKDGNETYSFECEGQFDLNEMKAQANFDFTDVNGTHKVDVGYQDEIAYLAYQDKLKAKLTKTSIASLLEYGYSLTEDEEFIGKINDLLKLDPSSMDFIGAIKEGELDTMLPKNTIDYVVNNEEVKLKLDLEPFGVKGNVELSIDPEFKNIEYLNFVMIQDGEQLTINFTMIDTKAIDYVDLETYIDFSSLLRLVPILKTTMFDHRLYALEGKVSLGIPVLGTLNLGLKADIRALDEFGKADGKIEIDVGIMSFITDDKKSSSAPYDVPSGYSVNSIKKRITTIYIHDDYFIIKRVDNIECTRLFASKITGTNIATRKYNFTDLKDNYMEIIYFSLGITDTAQGIINDQINGASDNGEYNDYSQIVTDYKYQDNVFGGGTYNIVANLGGVLHSSALSTVNLQLMDNGTQIIRLIVSTKVASVLSVNADFELKSLSTVVSFEEFDNYVSNYVAEAPKLIRN